MEISCFMVFSEKKGLFGTVCMIDYVGCDPNFSVVINL